MQQRLGLLLGVVVCAALLTIAPQQAAAQGEQPSANATAPKGAAAPRSAACAQLLGALGFASNLPVVFIHLTNASQHVRGVSPAQAHLLAKGPHLPGLMSTCGSPDGQDAESAPIRMHVRGSSSAVEYAKKSFALDPVDDVTNFEEAHNIEIPLLGLPRGKDWVLHGPENDRTLGMRNWLGYNAARRMGRYASRTQYFELFLETDPARNLSMDSYRGVYQLQEKVSRDKRRVNVTKYEASVDPSGGYLLAYENDNIYAGDTIITTRLTKLTMVVEYPKGRKGSEASQLWIQRWMNDFEARLLTQSVGNLTGWLDVPAAIDYFIITEVTKNPDGYRGSIKFHKDRGGPLVMGPIWDLNEAFGTCCGYPIEGYKVGGASNGTSGGSAISAAGWRFNICQDPGRCRAEPADGISQWYRRMWQEPAFRTAAAARWRELRASPDAPLADAWFVSEIAALKSLLGTAPGSAGARNWAKWGAAINVANYGATYPDWHAMFEAETRILQDWTLAHLRWLDAAFAAEADPAAPPDAYLRAPHGVVEPPVTGPKGEGPGGAPAVAGR